MADDRMRNDDDRQRKMGGGARDQDYGQQSPGRTSQQNKPGQHTGGQNERDMEDDDFDAGNRTGGQERNQNR